jgi:hypothetical protein
LEVDAEAVEKRFFGGHLHDGFVMAVSVEQGFARELRKLRVGREFLFEELAEQERLFAQDLGALVVREEVEEFVAEDGDAAGLEADDGDSGFDLGGVENVEEQGLGAIKHAEVVERASAAERGARDEDAVSGGLEDFDGGAGRGGAEVVVEGVGPEEDRGG